MPPLNTFEKTVISLALAQATSMTHAATITVSETCSLANAIRSANQTSAVGGCAAGVGNSNTIELPATETITLSSPELDGDLGAAGGSGLPLIESDITVQGNGAIIARSDAPGTPSFRLFGVTGSNAALTINSATLTNGFATNTNSGGYGGAIYAKDAAAVSIVDSVITQNYSAGNGGAIYAYASANIEIINSNVSSNSSAYSGGAIYGSFANSPALSGVRIYSSLLSNNVAMQNNGGALYFYRGANHAVSNSTLAKNIGTAGGGIFVYSAELELINSTVSDSVNAGPNGSLAVGGSNTFPPQVTLLNSVIANGSNGTDCTSYFPFTINATASWVESIDSDCVGGGEVPVGITEGDPLLGTLANNGGSLRTQAPLPGSGLLGAGDATICADPPINGLDQLQAARGVSSCTIGAVEQAVDQGATFVVPIANGKSVIFTL